MLSKIFNYMFSEPEERAPDASELRNVKTLNDKENANRYFNKWVKKIDKEILRVHRYGPRSTYSSRYKYSHPDPYHVEINVNSIKENRILMDQLKKHYENKGYAVREEGLTYQAWGEEGTYIYPGLFIGWGKSN